MRECCGSAALLEKMKPALAGMQTILTAHKPAELRPEHKQQLQQSPSHLNVNVISQLHTAAKSC